MTTSDETDRRHDAETRGPATVPPIVDRQTWQAARDELLVREKAHTRAGDTIAAARRRLPMTEVDATTTLVGPDGPRTLLDMTARGRLEAWQDDPDGWPAGKDPAWFWRSGEDGVATDWPGGRPAVQWTPPGATPVPGSEEHPSP